MIQSMDESMPLREHIVEAKNVKKYFSRTKGFRKKVVGTVKAVDDVSLSLSPGETLALVGESGSGKTTLGRTIMRAVEPTEGTVYYRFSADDSVDISSLDKRQLKAIRKNISLIFQDPYASLNPRMNVMEIVGEPIINYHDAGSKEEVRERVATLLQNVNLDPAMMSRYPHAFSGGQRQRIAIARALALEPKFVVADEPVSALDVSVQAQILNLLKELQSTFNLTYLFIAHNLGVVEYVSDRIAIMYVGKIVELSENEKLFGNPQHPYTEALLSAVPRPDPRRKRKKTIAMGDIADPANPPSGCYYHPRCRYAQEICSQKQPELKDIEYKDQQMHMSACHFSEDLSLTGMRTGQ